MDYQWQERAPEQVGWPHVNRVMSESVISLADHSLLAKMAASSLVFILDLEIQLDISHFPEGKIEGKEPEQILTGDQDTDWLQTLELYCCCFFKY